MATTASSPMLDGLFLLVNASNPVFKYGFQPVALTLLSLPFIGAMLFYGPTKVDLTPWYPVVLHSYPYILGLIGVLIIGTKTVSTFDRLLAGSDDHNVRSPYVKSYWTPFMEHAAELMTWGESFWTSARNSTSHPVFTVLFGGTRHVVIHSPSLIEHLEKQSKSVLARDTLYALAERNTFDIRFSRDAYKLNLDVYRDVLNNFETVLSAQKTIDRIARTFEQDLPNLISFNQSQVDQMLWEREVPMKIAGSPGDAESFVETTLSTLTKEFITHQVITELLGQSFVFEHPKMSSEDFKDFDGSLWSMALGLSRMFPAPGLVLAQAARNRLVGYLIDWIEDTSNAEAPILFALNTALESTNTTVSKDDKARFLLLIVWKICRDAIGTSFYLLYRIIANLENEASKAELESEISKFATASQSSVVVNNIAEPPQLKLNSQSVLNGASPFFQQSLQETRRLDYADWSIHQLKDDVILEESTADVPADPQAKAIVWKLKKDEWVHFARPLHNSDSKAFVNPNIWNMKRSEYGEEDEKLKQSQPKQKVGSSEAIAFAFVAGVLSLWDIEVLSKRYVKSKVKIWPGGWRNLPQDVPVRIKRRKLVEAGTKQ